MNQPENAVFEQEKTIEHWDRDYYHLIAEQYYDRAILDMLRMMEAQPGARILDAGCGPGVHAVRVARAGYQVTGVDISQTMLREAQSRVNAAQVSKLVEFHREDLTKLSFSDAAFRHVFSWGVIIHIRDVDKALDELARITEPGGTLALYVTNENSVDQKLETFLRFLIRKPLARETYSIGTGVWYQMNDNKLWVWQFNIPELQRQLKTRDLHLIHRRSGEFSEIQRRVSGPLRKVLLHLNNLFYRLHLAPNYAVANILVFRKANKSAQ